MSFEINRAVMALVAIILKEGFVQYRKKKKKKKKKKNNLCTLDNCLLLHSFVFHVRDAQYHHVVEFV